MKPRNTTYILVNYTLGSASTGIEDLERDYPNLIFTQITISIYLVEVPEGQEAEFTRLMNNVGYVTYPIVYGLSAEPALEVSNISIFHNYPYGTLRGNGILVGFVDTGIDYTNPLFQNADGSTRIVSLWDQTINGNPPEPFNYGTVYTAEDINRALAAENPYEVVPSRDEIGHGTFLAGVAVGNDQTDDPEFVGGAPDADIIMVKMRQASTQVRDFYLINQDAVAYQGDDILAGIKFLLSEAYNRQQPLVVCIGVGSNLGAHNGTDALELYIEQISFTNGVIVVTAAGNEADLGGHYQGTVQQNSQTTVEINVAESERGFFLLLWTQTPNRIQIALQSPLGQRIERIPVVYETQRFRFNLENTSVSVNYIYPDPFAGGEEIAIRFENPTPGIWQVIVYGDENLDTTFNMWLPRQSFIEENTQFLNSSPDTTVQIPATQNYNLVVGAYDHVDGSIYIGSGRGPTTQGLIKPDLIAPGVNVRGPRPGGGFTTYVGTSTAAAVTASACALLLEWALLNQNLNSINTRIAITILTRGASRQRNVIYPNNIEGYGRLDLRNSIAGI